MLTYERSQLTCTLKGGIRYQEELGGVEKAETESGIARSGSRTTQEKGPRQQVGIRSRNCSSNPRIIRSNHRIDCRLKRSGGGGVHTSLPVF